MKSYAIILLILFQLVLNACKTNQAFFSTKLIGDKSYWTIEQQPGGSVNFSKNKMEVVDAKGCTIWFNEKLEGNLRITYDITLIDANGLFDRVSDMNCFWMANDPNNPDDFFSNSKQRAGRFKNYHNLILYYVGYGGHNNTRTRFRRYDGNVDRPLMPEHDLSDKKYMVTANKKMQIEILVEYNYTSYKKDGEVIFKLTDPELYKNGYFGFRTVNNHMIIENFKISRLN